MQLTDKNKTQYGRNVLKQEEIEIRVYYTNNELKRFDYIPFASMEEVDKLINNETATDIFGKEISLGYNDIIEKIEAFTTYDYEYIDYPDKEEDDLDR